jgi:type II secretory pathway component PulK
MRTRRGATFIMTVAILASVVAVLVGARATQQVAVRSAINRMEQRRAKLAAQAGLTYCLKAFEGQSATTTTTSDTWYSYGNAGGVEYDLGNTSFRIQIIDESSRVDLNTADETMLQKLPLTQEQIDSLQDWREAGTTPRPQGAKNDYYAALDHPYYAKYRTLDSMDELLQVRGFTASTLYAPQNITGNNLITDNPSNPSRTSGQRRIPRSTISAVSAPSSKSQAL